MKRHIAERLADPGLGVASLARAFRMSERSVHKVFQGSRNTVSQFIRESRLERCRRDLQSSTLASRARHWGFADPSQVSKAFRAAYGISPRDFHAQALAHARAGTEVGTELETQLEAQPVESEPPK
jgi:AraC-like DNA-binding protein